MDKINKQFKIKSVSCYSTDALFMETEELIDDLKNMKIECIDMECSALASISYFRKVNATFIFCVSDVLTKDGWEYNINIDLRRILVDSLLALCMI
jgi:purine-nucleoside phosphorylase